MGGIPRTQQTSFPRCAGRPGPSLPLRTVFPLSKHHCLPPKTLCTQGRTDSQQQRGRPERRCRPRLRELKALLGQDRGGLQGRHPGGRGAFSRESAAHSPRPPSPAACDSEAGLGAPSSARKLPLEAGTIRPSGWRPLERSTRISRRGVQCTRRSVSGAAGFQELWPRASAGACLRLVLPGPSHLFHSFPLPQTHWWQRLQVRS